MKNLSSIISSFEEIGLTKQADRLRSINKFLKIAQIETSTTKELQILEQLLSIVTFFEGQNLDALSSPDLYLPAYSIETGDKYVVFNEYPLADYSKKEVLGTGLTDYLQNFVDLYMKNKVNQFEGLDQRKYKEAIEVLEDARVDLSKNYKQLEKPVSFKEKLEKEKELTKSGVQTQLRRLTTLFNKISQFQLQVEERYIPLLAYSYGGEIEDGKFISHETPDQPSLLERLTDLSDEEDDEEDSELEEFEEVEQQEVSEQPAPKPQTQPKSQEDVRKNLLERFKKKSSTNEVSLAKQTAFDSLANLHFDFENVRNRVDQKYASKLRMTIEQFRSRLKIDEFLGTVSSLEKVASSWFDKYKQQPVRPKSKSVKDRVDRYEKSRKAIRDIIDGKFGYEEKKPGETRRKFYLYTPDHITAAWDTLTKEVEIVYEGFIKAVYRKFLSLKQRRSTKERKFDEKQEKFYESSKELASEYIRSSDSNISNSLSEAINLLRDYNA